MDATTATKRDRRAGVVYLCGTATRGNVEPVTSLYGRKVHCLAGGDAALLALADDGLYAVPDGTLLSCLEFANASVGKSCTVAVTASGSLYSWGVGELGELGQGPVRTVSEEPAFISHTSAFTACSAGATHSLAVDVHGNGYAWGQNWDAQLGLYNKPLSALVKLKPSAATGASLPTKPPLYTRPYPRLTHPFTHPALPRIAHPQRTCCSLHVSCPSRSRCPPRSSAAATPSQPSSRARAWCTRGARASAASSEQGAAPSGPYPRSSTCRGWEGRARPAAEQGRPLVLVPMPQGLGRRGR